MKKKRTKRKINVRIIVYFIMKQLKKINEGAIFGDE